MTSLELPDGSLTDLLRNSYPSLIAHAASVYEKAFPDGSAFPPTTPASVSISLKSLVPWPRPSQRPKLNLASAEEKKEEDSDEERSFRLARWAWTGAAVSSVLGYLYFTGLGGILLKAVFLRASTGNEINGQDDVDEDKDDDTGVAAMDDDDDDEDEA